MTEINVAAGRRIAIIHRAFSSVPIDYRFSAKVASPGQVLGGVVEIRKSCWIVPGSPVKLSLQENNVVSAGFWTTFMSVDVVPDVDVVITTERRGSRKLLPILLIALLVIVAAAVMAVAFRG